MRERFSRIKNRRIALQKSRPCKCGLRQILQFLQYNCIEFFQKLKKLNFLQAKVQTSKRKAVNISESDISSISFDCNASEAVRDPSSACHFT